MPEWRFAVSGTRHLADRNCLHVNKVEGQQKVVQSLLEADHSYRVFQRKPNNNGVYKNVVSILLRRKTSLKMNKISTAFLETIVYPVVCFLWICRPFLGQCLFQRGEIITAPRCLSVTARTTRHAVLIIF